MDISTQLGQYQDMQDESDLRDYAAELIYTNPLSTALDAETMLVLYALAINYLETLDMNDDIVF